MILGGFILSCNKSANTEVTCKVKVGFLNDANTKKSALKSRKFATKDKAKVSCIIFFS